MSRQRRSLILDIHRLKAWTNSGWNSVWVFLQEENRKREIKRKRESSFASFFNSSVHLRFCNALFFQMDPQVVPLIIIWIYYTGHPHIRLKFPSIFKIFPIFKRVLSTKIEVSAVYYYISLFWSLYNRYFVLRSTSAISSPFPTYIPSIFV